MAQPHHEARDYYCDQFFRWLRRDIPDDLKKFGGDVEVMRQKG